MRLIATIALLFTFYATADARTVSGLASYYGTEAGSQTASGQRMSNTRLTAAHRTLPFGTRLQCEYRGRSVTVTVNDRGPFIRGRVLDLSVGAARVIGLIGAGVGRVSCEEV
jgi:rare lipoprotein A